jgi:predicted RNase H-like HicB family nuclease
MKMPEGIMIREKKSGMFFGFMARFPGIWAQGKTREEVNEKIDKIRRAFIQRLESTTHIEMNEYEM